MANKESFEQEELRYSFTGDWIRTNQRAYEGNFSYGSKVLSHNQQSNAYLTVTTDYVEFYWFVSSESGYDWFEFYIDGVREIRESGTNNTWTKFSKGLPKGEHTFRWRYTKDGSVDRGDDRAYIDCLVINLGEHRYLIVDSGYVKIWSNEDNCFQALMVEDEINGELVDVTPDNLSEDLILSFGMEELPRSKAGLNDLKPKILYYTNDEDIVSDRENLKLKITETVSSLPKIAVEDIGRELQEKISSINIEEDVTGLGDLQYALSKDRSSWFVYDIENMKWEQVDISSDIDFAEKGMKKLDFSFIGEENYEELFNKNDYLYLAFRFFKSELTDESKFKAVRVNYVSSIEMTV